jgi:hypothetical protein
MSCVLARVASVRVRVRVASFSSCRRKKDFVRHAERERFGLPVFFLGLRKNIST